MTIWNVLSLDHIESCKFLKKYAPILGKSEGDVKIINAIDAWNHFDFLCKNYKLNGFNDSLYSVYAIKKITNEL